MKLSIITINFNDKIGLQKTIESVAVQSFNDFEYIVIDGGSIDGSVDVINKYDSKITYWVSESDNGIYDAMNKGVKQANGEYCLFLNSGDYLVDSFVLQKVFKNNFSEDFVYGDLICKSEDGKCRELIFPDKITFFQLFSSFLPHPATFIKRKCFEVVGNYEEKYSIVADWAFMTKAIGKHGCSTRHIRQIVSCHALGGISSNPQHQQKNIDERNDFLQKEFQIFCDDYGELTRYRSHQGTVPNVNEGELAAVYASREWRAALKMRKMVKIIVPTGSLRRRIVVKTFVFFRKISVIPLRIVTRATDYLGNMKKPLMTKYAEHYIKTSVLPRIKEYKKEIPKKDKFNNILAINTIASNGGAARAAYDMLCKNFKSKGFDTCILCDQSKIKDDGDIILLNKSNNVISKILDKFGYLDLGHKSYRIKEMDCFKKADIVHLHNLHGGYFNSAFLPELTALKPTLWTLHDEQAITGHCAIPLDCARWQNGCNKCQHLGEYPSIACDKSNYLWNLKKSIYDKSDFIVVTPSKWLKHKVEKSILKDKDIRCIYHGLDENVWKPYDKQQVRDELHLPLDKKILLFLSHGSIYNKSKGGGFILDAIENFKDQKDVIFLIVGHDIELDFDNVISRGYIYDKNELAKYYSSADLFIFPTLSETFGFVTVEAMACGTPVISFDNSATPELVDHMKSGYLAKYKDLDDFIVGISLFLSDDDLRRRASKFAREKFLEKFTLTMCLKNYRDLYEELWSRRLRK